MPVADLDICALTMMVSADDADAGWISRQLTESRGDPSPDQIPREGESNDDVSNAIAQVRRMRLRILVVDDEDVFRVTLVKRLKECYHADVSDVEGGADALDWTAAEPFDLVLMDIWMQDQDGLETCRQMQERGVESLIVLMTAELNAQRYRARAEELGVELLTKPIDPEDLAQALLRRQGGA